MYSVRLRFFMPKSGRTLMSYYKKGAYRMDKKTPLYDCHVAQGGKIVPFAGYLLPVQYTDVIAEHMATRTACGLFDVSHMGEFTLEGADALHNLNALFTNDFTNMADGRVRYSPLCNDNGGIVDDLIVYRNNADSYMIVVNASNREKDFAFLAPRVTGNAVLRDVSDDYVQIALQGPRAAEILATLVRAEDIPQKYYTFVSGVVVNGIDCIVSRTGYTGEDGFELYCAADAGPRLWNILLDAGKPFGLIPCGLGARDTLRLEAGMPLYGHEMDDDVSPFETGLGYAVKMDKPDFIGTAGIISRGEPSIARVGLKMTGRGIAREHCDVYVGGEKIGHTTSGTFLPFLSGAYAMALVDREHAAVGTEMEVDVRGRRIAAEVVPLPFYTHG